MVILLFVRNTVKIWCCSGWIHFQILHFLTLHRRRTVRFDGEVDDNESDANPGHDHEKIKSAAFLVCSSFGADTDCSLSPFPFSPERRRWTKLCLLPSTYRRHQQGVLSGSSWTLNIELFLICIGATPTGEDGIMNHTVPSRHVNEWRRCPNQRSSGFSSQEADGKDKLWMSAVVDTHKSSYD